MTQLGTVIVIPDMYMRAHDWMSESKCDGVGVRYWY